MVLFCLCGASPRAVHTRDCFFACVSFVLFFVLTSDGPFLFLTVLFFGWTKRSSPLSPRNRCLPPFWLYPFLSYCTFFILIVPAPSDSSLSCDLDLTSQNTPSYLEYYSAQTCPVDDLWWKWAVSSCMIIKCLSPREKYCCQLMQSLNVFCIAIRVLSIYPRLSTVIHNGFEHSFLVKNNILLVLCGVSGWFIFFAILAPPSHRKHIDGNNNFRNRRTYV